MTELLKEAMRRVSELPDEQQDAVAALVLAELESEARWDDAFAGSQDLLESLVSEATSLDKKGQTSSLNFDEG